MENKIEERFEEFVFASGGAKIHRRKYIDARERLMNSLIELQTDKEFLNEMSEFVSDLKDTNQDFQKLKERTKLAEKNIDNREQDIQKVFEIVFEGTRSKNHEVCKLPDEKWTLTCGKKGFARRDNVQAQDLDRHEMRLVLDNAEFVARHLRKQNMTKAADRITRFAKVVPERKYSNAYGSRDLVTVHLKSTILVPEINSYRSSSVQDVRRYTDISYSNGTLYLHCYEDDELLELKEFDDVVNDAMIKKNRGDAHEEDEDDEDEERNNVHGISMNENIVKEAHSFEALVWYQLKDQIHPLISELLAKITTEVEDLCTEMNDLKKEFGKELLVDVL